MIANAESLEPPVAPPQDRRALVAVDLGAESCRVSLLRWHENAPQIELLHRFANGPEPDDTGSLRWPLQRIVEGVDHGMKLAAERATEGIRSVAVDGWAVDYVRLDRHKQPLADPFCYRDERTIAAERELHQRIAPDRLKQITGLQLQQLNTVYQLYADKLAALPAGEPWLNLPEYLLARWGGELVSEYTNATHTEMLAIDGRSWSREILYAIGIEPASMPPLVPPGTIVGKLRGPLAELAAFHDTTLIAPACHDTASAIAGIPATGENWGYISSGTWSLVGTVLDGPCQSFAAMSEGFTNLGSLGERVLFQKNLNGMWMIKQCMDAWAASGNAWEIAALCAAAELEPHPLHLLDIDDPELLRVGNMPAKINAQLRRAGQAALDESSAAAPALASLIFHSLATRYAATFLRIEELTGKRMDCVYIVGGGSKNRLLRRLTEQACGRKVIAGVAESSTLGNFAVQLAALEAASQSRSFAFCDEVGRFAKLLAAT